MIFYRTKSGLVYLRVYDKTTRAGKTLPRSESRQLDPLSDEEIDRWIIAKEASENSTMVEVEPLGPSVISGELLENFARWLAYLEHRKLNPNTIKQHKSNASRFMFEYFGRVACEPNPNLWPLLTGRFYNWLVSSGNLVSLPSPGNTAGETVLVRAPCTPHQIRTTNITFRKFYNWLSEEAIVPAVELRMRPPMLKRPEVQLTKVVSPEDVLAWARSCGDAVVKFVGLVGYFFSLRPQETFALRRQDFLGGKEIELLECGRVMRGANLFSRLGVYVGRQKQNNGEIGDSAKKGSNGWVCCFNEEAARLVVSLLEELESDTVVARWNNKKLYNSWSNCGIPGTTIKDMRRASLYWLAHETDLQPVHLMKHARHRNIQTTLIYCQRPEEELRHFKPSLNMYNDEPTQPETT